MGVEGRTVDSGISSPSKETNAFKQANVTASGEIGEDLCMAIYQREEHASQGKIVRHKQNTYNGNILSEVSHSSVRHCQ